jgi:ribonuclease HII
MTEKKLKFSLDWEEKAWKQNKLFIGIDEAGYGSGAGDMFVAAVAFPIDFVVPWALRKVKDSKAIKDSRLRTKLAFHIKQYAHYFTIVSVSPAQMLIRSPYYLRFEAIANRLEKEAWLHNNATTLLDGNTPIKSRHFNNTCLVKGDALVFSVAAASILAKHAKDVEMKNLNRIYPNYGFGHHSGYLSPEHIAAIKQYGPIPEIHREAYLRKLYKTAEVASI